MLTKTAGWHIIKLTYEYMFICLTKKQRVKAMAEKIKPDCVKCRSIAPKEDCSCQGQNCPRANIDDKAMYDLAELFKVFGDGTRIKIISALMEGEMCVYHLSQKLGAGQSAVSHQLRILRSAGLVRPRREGKEIYYSLDDEHVEEIYSAGLAHIIHKAMHKAEEENENE